jgi:type I restriction enzyme M protein
LDRLSPLYELASVTQGLSTSGPGAGSRLGDWNVQVVDSADIQDDRLTLENLRTIDIQQNVKTEKHLLKPYDVLVTARSTTIKVALVPPSISRTVAGATLLAVRPFEPELGLGHYLWYFFTSAHGRAQIATRLTAGATIASLSARSMEQVMVPLPDASHLYRLTSLIEESERAYAAALEAAQQRRTVIRDHIINSLREASRSSYAIDHV